jgi:hypothetical protein
MDLVRLEDAVDMSIIFAIMLVAEAGGVVIRTEFESQCATLFSTKNTNSPRDMQREMRHTFGWTYKYSS